MKTFSTLLFLLLALTLPCPALADHHAIKIAAGNDGGQYLTDAKGMALYWFKQDSPDKSTCAGPCAQNWPIYYREAVAPPAGIAASDFATISREDGQKQTTFRGYPLYYWKGDEKAGDTRGQGVRGVWFLIDPANFPMK